MMGFLALSEVSLARSSSVAERNLETLLTTRSCPRCDLTNLDMTRLDLSRTDIEGADLSFSACNLTNFSYANLRGVTFYKTSLIGVDLEGADLRNVKMQETSLESAFLGDTLLNGGPETKSSGEEQGDRSGSRSFKSYGKPSPSIASGSGYGAVGKEVPYIRAGQSKKVLSESYVKKQERPLLSSQGKSTPKTPAFSAQKKPTLKSPVFLPQGKSTPVIPSFNPANERGKVSFEEGVVEIHAIKKKNKKEGAEQVGETQGELKRIRALPTKKLFTKGPSFENEVRSISFSLSTSCHESINNSIRTVMA